MGKRPATDKAAESAQPTDAISAAAQAAEANVPTDNTPLADASAIAPSADGSVDNVPEAVAAARQSAAQIEAALAVLGADNPAVVALQAALAEANGAVALAEAEAALQAAKAAQIEAAQAAATAASLPEAVLAAMLAAIEAQYAPAPVEAEAAPEAAPQMPTFGRKQPSARTLAANAAALAAAAADPTLAARPAAALAAFDKHWAASLAGVARVAGTRFASIVALAGGVTGEADYRHIVPIVRQHLLNIGLSAGGNSYASLPWILAAGPHAAGGDKGEDSLPLKFLGGAHLALWQDGMFRLALPSQTGVRFLRSDAAALAAFRSGAAAAPVTPQAAPDAPQSGPSKPHVPTAPNAVADPQSGAITRTARCQYCSGRNIVGSAECAACGEADWQVA